MSIQISVTGENTRQLSAKLADLAKLTALFNDANKEVAAVQAPEAKTEAPKKKAKATEETFDLGDSPVTEPATISKDEIVLGFKTYAADNGREKAANILKKFKVKSVHDLKPETYVDVMGALNG